MADNRGFYVFDGGANGSPDHQRLLPRSNMRVSRICSDRAVGLRGGGVTILMVLID